MPRTHLCLHCGHSFVPSAYNKHHQRYCTAPECQKARKRLNQQACRKRQMAAMDEQQLSAFHYSECLRINRSRRKSRRQRKEPPGTPPSLSDLSLRQEKTASILYGLCARLTALYNSEELALVIGKYSDLGQRLLHPQPAQPAGGNVTG